MKPGLPPFRPLTHSLAQALTRSLGRASLGLAVLAMACSTPPPADEATDTAAADDSVVADVGIDAIGSEDTGKAVEDTGPTIEDAGKTVEDTGKTVEDTGTTVEDTGTKTEDTGTKTEDTGTKTEDTGTKTEDTGTKTEDTAKAEDTGGSTDAGSDPDAGGCKKTDPDKEICDGIDNDCDGKTDNLACEDGNTCTIDECQKVADKFECQYSPALNAACSDGNGCTKSDKCKGTACVAETPCEDGNACTEDKCDQAKGTCSNPALKDGASCGGGKTCSAGQCVLAGACAGKKDGDACDDKDACTQGDTCKANQCVSGKAKICTDDGSSCTAESCDPTNGDCVSKPDNEAKACDDSNKCTSKTTCKAGKCGGGDDLECKDTNPCTLDKCDANNGCVFPPATDGVACGNGNVCKAGKCEPATACGGKADGAPCEDANACTQKDSCKAGECAPGTPLDCNDGNDCTKDSCDPKNGCQNVALGDGDKCDDGNACTTGDVCATGKCQAGKNTCPTTCGNNKCETGETCKTCADDCGPCVGAAPVAFSLAAGSPGALAGPVKPGPSANVHVQGLDLLSSEPPATSGTVSANVGGKDGVTGQAGYTTEALPAEWLGAIVRNTTVHHDHSLVSAHAQVRDGAGRARVKAGTQAKLVLAVGTNTVSGTCFVNASGVCNAQLNAALNWFKPGADVTAKAHVEVGTLKSTPVNVTLNGLPKFAPPPAKGMELQLPLGPRLPGTSYKAEIWAYTGGEVLESFDINVTFDSAKLKVVSAAIDKKYTSATNTKADSVIFVAVREGKVKDADVKGKVHVADITFQVIGKAGEKGAVSGTITSMFNVQNVALVDKGEAIGIKSGTGTANSGDVVVAANPIRGIYGIAAKSEVANLARLSGKAQSFPIKAWAVRTAVPDESIKPTCQSGNAKAIGVDAACAATLKGSETADATKVGISLSHAGQKASVPFRVWLPTAVKVQVGTAKLAPVEGWQDCSSGAAMPVRTPLSVVATFKNGAVERTVHVRDHLNVGADGTTFKVEGNWLVGLKPGKSEIVSGPGPLNHKLPVEMLGKPVKATGLSVVALTGVQVGVEPPPASAVKLDKPATVSATLQQQLHAEFAEAKVVAWVKTADGNAFPVTEEMGLTVKTLDKNVVETLAKPLRVKAISTGAGDLVEATWTACKKPVATGKAAVKVKLPPPTGATLSVNAQRIAWKKTDPAAVAGVPAESGLVATLKYDNGTTKNFTLDARTQFDDASMDPSDLFTVSVTKDKDGKPTKVTIVPTGKGVGIAKLKVTFKHAPKISAIANVNIVKHEKFTLTAHPWPSYSGSDVATKTTLHKLEATGVWQKAILDLKSHLTDKHVLDVTTRKDTSYATHKAGTKTADNSVLGIAAAVISPLKAGKIDVHATFAGAGSDPLAITAEDKPVNVKSLDVKFVATFTGLKGKATATPQVWATFVDGTQLDAMKVKGLLSFSSALPAKIKIDAATGTSTLMDNHNRKVKLTAKAKTSGVVGSADSAPNLAADVGDIDLGQTNGVAHPDVKPGQAFVMPMRVNTGGKALGSIDVTVKYDKDVIEAVKGEAGGGWPGGQFDVTVNDPPGIVHVVGAAKAGSAAIGNNLEVARLHFKGVKKTGKTETQISGFITKLLQNTTAQGPIGPALGPGQTRPIVAGAGLLDPPCANDAKPDSFIGNTNGDCEFSVGDVSFALFYLADKVDKSKLAPFQKKYLDADGNGDINVADAVYLLRVLANKFRFVSVKGSLGSNGEHVVTVTLLDKNGKPVAGQTKVFLHLKSTEAPKLVTGKLVTNTKDGPVVETVADGKGGYSISTTFAKDDKLQVAVVIKTTDALGKGSADRDVALNGSPWLSSLSPFAAAATFDVKASSGGGGGCKQHVDCDDKNACTKDTCEAGGKCLNAPIPNAPGCGPKCTADGDCNDNNKCTKDTCDKAKSQCVFTPDASQSGCGKPCTGDAECNDNNDCTIDKCTNKVCTNTDDKTKPQCGGATCAKDADCDDSDACTKNTCNATLKKCEFPPDPTSTDPKCVGKPCSKAADCDDKDPCTFDSCDHGKCEQIKFPQCGKACSKPTDCDDSNKCTIDSCTNSKCTYAPNTQDKTCGPGGGGGCQFNNQCDDKNDCTVDTCVNSKCENKPDTVNPKCGTGCKIDADCDDADKCTQDQCVSEKCQHNPIKGQPGCNEIKCKVGGPVVCKADEFCGGICGQDGQCQKRPTTCSGGTTHCGCDGKDYKSSCEAKKAGMEVAKDGTCSGGGGGKPCSGDAQCDDQQGCTADKCVNKVCENKLDLTLPTCKGTGKDCKADTECKDTDDCTQDKCLGGKCSNVKDDSKPGCHDSGGGGDACLADKDCNDLKMCTKDSCKGGKCEFLPDFTCVPKEKCDQAVDCDDKDACTDDSCENKACKYKLSTKLECQPTKTCTIGKAGDCAAGMFCKAKNAAQCGGDGICTVVPKTCDTKPAGVCGCDSQSYANECFAHKQGVNVKNSGSCPAKTCKLDGDCNDNKECTVDKCAAGICTNEPDKSKPQCIGACTNDANCNDDDDCTNDKCVSGKCTNTVDKTKPGCDFKACKIDGDCTDTDKCTIDKCVTGKCAYSKNTSDPTCVPKTCSEDSDCWDMNTCTKDTCSSGKCTYAKVTDISGCGSGSPPVSCSKASDCLHPTKKCQHGFCFQSKCGFEDIKQCLASSCSSDKECADSNACTKDFCSDGMCVNAPINGCTIKKCNSAAECDDKDPCTKDACTDNACTYTKDATCGGATKCDIGKEGTCKATELCKQTQAGVCSGSGVCVAKPTTCSGFKKVCSCDNITFFNECEAYKAGKNVAKDGECQVTFFCGNDNDCNDGNQCTVGKCVSGKCDFTTKPGCTVKTCNQDGDCDDKNNCTSDICVAGKCANNVNPTIPGCSGGGGCTVDGECDDKDACTVDKCLADGKCENKTDATKPGCGGKKCNANADCNDNKPCTNDQCESGVCKNTDIPGCGGSGCEIGKPCGTNKVCMKMEAACSGTGQCMDVPASCPPMTEKVCGCDGKTYTNFCFAMKAGTAIGKEGACN